MKKKDMTRDVCPNCGAAKLKSWDELSEDEKIVARVQPASATFTRAEREKHRLCTRCWYETDERSERLA